MPTLSVETSYGTIPYNYTISTPDSTSATKIQTGIPTILFLHSVYLASCSFQHQFSNDHLRRFNLVSVDLIGHGETGGKVPESYDQETAADDIMRFMALLNLPPCYIFGISLGTIIGLQIAVTFPDRVLGIFLVSPMGTEEVVDVAATRNEIFACWDEGVREKDEEAISHCIYGVLQLAVNNLKNSFISALAEITYKQVLCNWDKDSLDDCRRICNEFLNHRKSYPKEELSRLAGKPVILVYGAEDIVYIPEYYSIFQSQLEDAGVTFESNVIKDAPQFVHVTSSSQLNPLIEKFVLDSWKGAQPPLITGSVVSPFEILLLEAGWNPDESELAVVSSSEEEKEGYIRSMIEISYGASVTKLEISGISTSI